MNSLPVGGMMTRIACGRMVRRIVRPHATPSALEASASPSGTDEMPARTISAMYAASFMARPTTASQNAEYRTIVSSNRTNCRSVNGIPNWTWRYRVKIRPQNSSCT